MAGFTMEKRALKRLRIGPPDVYPQDPKQKEDELTAVNVKQGYSHTPLLSDEYGSAAKHFNIPVTKIQTFLNGILTKKQEINALLDTARKKQQINSKEHFHPVTQTPKSKSFVETWFRDLAGTKPLSNLGKKIPIFNKREDTTLVMLCEHQVPMVRAIWLIKMTAAYNSAMSEAKIKKRQLPDPSQEWTGNMVRFLKDQLVKLQEFYSKATSSGASSSTPSIAVVVSSASTLSTPQAPVMSDEQKLALKQWTYCQQLCKVMFEEGLLDHQEFLQSLLDILDKCKVGDEGSLRLVFPSVLQYLDHYVKCELLSRRLAYQVSRRLTPLLNVDQADASSSSSSVVEISGCAHHRSLVVQLSSAVQAICLHCPTALVWSYAGEGKSPSYLNGSPLDHLPLAPSLLPMPPRASNQAARQQLREAEESIKQRSRAAESRWALEHLCQPSSPNLNVFSQKSKNQHQQQQQPYSGLMTSKVLQALESLDRHCFDRVDSSNCIDALYGKIFPPLGNSKSGSEQLSLEQATQVAKQDEPLIRMLCQWAVCDQRHGEHRAMATALLLEKRQADLVAAVEGDASPQQESESSETASPSLPQPVYQTFLMKFLDTEAPVLGEPGSRTVFGSLVHLFYELIKHDVFSHDAYMCTLISRGDLLSNNQSGGSLSSSGVTSHAGGPVGGSLGGFHNMHDVHNEMDDSKIDDDLDKLVQNIVTKEGQQIVMDTADSPKDSHHGGLESSHGRGDKEGKRQSRHLLFTTHFPLPQDDSLSHDCNQRHILLYGVGKAREEARHVVKRVSKEICRLFHKKLSVDVQAEGTSGSSKSKKHSSRSEFNFENNMQRFYGLSYFDRHLVTAQAAAACLETISSFAAGSSGYLAVLEHVSFLLDLYEISLNISGLIEFCLQLLKELPEVELQLAQRNSALTRTYVTNLGLYIVGVLRRFHCCLLLSVDLTTAAFEALCRIVKHVSNPADCTSAERCILAYLYDMYTCCSFLKGKAAASHHDAAAASSASGAEVQAFANAYPKIKQTIFAPVQPSMAVHPLSRDALLEYISNPRRRPEQHLLRQLSESPQLRYSFVCNAVIAVCNTVENDRLNDIALLCAELTAGCPSLSSEWLGVLTALCCASSTYIDVLTHIDVQDLSLHQNLAVLFSVLLARHCFGLQDFLLHVGLPSLVKPWNEGRGEADSEAEAGARLTCHLLLRMFKTLDTPQPACYSSSSHSVNASPHPTLQQANTPLTVKLACDRHLLAATHNSIPVVPVLAVLKAVLVLADLGHGDGRSSGTITATSRLSSMPSISHILGTSDLSGGDMDFDLGSNFGTGPRSNLGSGGDSMSLSAYARYALKQICTQPWVHERCLQSPEELLKSDGLLDTELTTRQAQRLLQMICRPETAAAAADEGTANQHQPQDYRQIVNKVLDNLDQWRLRVAWLDLQLLCRQLSSTERTTGTVEMNQFLDAVARGSIDVFQLSSMGLLKEDDASVSPNKKRTEVPTPVAQQLGKTVQPQSVWLVAPLIAKLPGSVQGRVLKVASQVLESCNWSSPSKQKDKERPVQPPRQKSLLSHEPFLTLVMTCLKGQDEQREGLLSSLKDQLSYFLALPKEDRIYQGDDPRARQAMLEALQLRFSLVGGLFDTILRSPSSTVDWALLLVQLVTSGLIDLSNNSQLFTTLLDMLATLIHSTAVADAQSERSEDSKKHQQNLQKKLKKELGEKQGASVYHLRQLLQIPKPSYDVVSCEPYGSQTDAKGNKISGFDDKKQGMRLCEKQRVSQWDTLEGFKTPAPLSWAWFGAVRVERKPLRRQETIRLMRHHTHSLQKPFSYFLEHPPLPPEEIEPPMEKIPMKEEPLFKVDTPTLDQSPRGGPKRGSKTNQRRPRGRRGGGNTPIIGGQPPVQHMGGYQSPSTGMYPPAQPSQWSGYGNSGPGTQPAGQGGVPFYPQTMPQSAAGPRFADRPGIQSRPALSNMLRQRQPGGQYMPGAPAGNPMGPVATPGAPAGPVTSGPRGPMSQMQAPFQNLQMVDKQRQQYIRQQMRPGPPMYGQTGMQQPSQQHQVSMGQSGFPAMQQNIQQPMNQNFGMFQNGNQAGMNQHMGQQQQQPTPQPAQQQQQQQPIIGGHFNQGGNFPMQQQQAQPQQQQGNMLPMQQQQQQQQQVNRGMGPRPPFMSGGNMPMAAAQQTPGFPRAPMNATAQQQQAARLQQQQQQQMMAMQQQQQQQQQQQMQHGMGQQHYHQQF